MMLQDLLHRDYESKKQKRCKRISKLEDHILFPGNWEDSTQGIAQQIPGRESEKLSLKKTK